MKDKTVAAILAFLFGAVGAHRWYLGDVGSGCFYLAFSWTGIPYLLGIFEGLAFLLMDQAEFDRRYNQGPLGIQDFGMHTITTVTTVDPQGRQTTTTRRTGSATAQDQGLQFDIPTGRPTNAGTRDYQMRRPRDAQELERFVLQAARDSDGILTPTDLSLTTQLSLRESRDALEGLVNQDVCQLDVDINTGATRYVFPDFLTDAGRTRLSGDDSDPLTDDLHAR